MCLGTKTPDNSLVKCELATLEHRQNENDPSQVSSYIGTIRTSRTLSRGKSMSYVMRAIDTGETLSPYGIFPKDSPDLKGDPRG